MTAGFFSLSLFLSIPPFPIGCLLFHPQVAAGDNDSRGLNHKKGLTKRFGKKERKKCLYKKERRRWWRRKRRSRPLLARAHQRWWDLWKIYSTHQENPRCDPPSHILLFFSSSFFLFIIFSFLFSSSPRTACCTYHSSRPIYNNDCPLVWILWRWIDIKVDGGRRVTFLLLWNTDPVRCCCCSAKKKDSSHVEWLHCIGTAYIGMIDQIGYSTDRRRYGLFWESELVASTQVGGRITINKISSETKKKATSIHNNFRNNYSGICSLDEAPSPPYITHTLLSLLRLDCLEYIDSTGPRYNMARNRSSTLEIASSFDAISHFASTNILERTGMQLRDSCDLFEGTLSLVKHLAPTKTLA